MAVVRIKAGGASEKTGRDRLMREVKSAASRILDVGADLVLVVYGATDANIYYEPGAAMGASAAKPAVKPS